MTVVKYGSEAWALQKTEEDLLGFLQRTCLQIVLGAQPTDNISVNGLYEKCDSILLSRAIARERLIREHESYHVLQMKGDRLLKIVFFAQPSRAQLKAGYREILRKLGTSLVGVKKEALNRLGWRSSMHSCAGLRWLGALVS